MSLAIYNLIYQSSDNNNLEDKVNNLEKELDKQAILSDEDKINIDNFLLQIDELNILLVNNKKDYEETYDVLNSSIDDLALKLKDKEDELALMRKEKTAIDLTTEIFTSLIYAMKTNDTVYISNHTSQNIYFEENVIGRIELDETLTLPNKDFYFWNDYSGYTEEHGENKDKTIVSSIYKFIDTVSKDRLYFVVVEFILVDDIWLLDRIYRTHETEDPGTPLTLTLG